MSDFASMELDRRERDEMSDLVNRLRGIYTIPVNDGAGLLDGKATFTRTFDKLPPIMGEAADEIERLTAALADMTEGHDSYREDYKASAAALHSACEKWKAVEVELAEAHRINGKILDQTKRALDDRDEALARVESLVRALRAVRTRVENEMGTLITLDVIDAALAKEKP